MLVLGLGACRGPHATAPAVAPAAADMLLTGGVVYTLDEAQPWAEAVAIVDDAIAWVGSTEDAASHLGANTIVVELHGRMVLPGFHDAHVHPVTGGMELGQCDLNHARDVAEVEATIRECVRRGAEGEWIVGGGWDLTLFPAANPTRAQLDAIASDRPIYLTSADAHSAWVNGEALRRAGVDARTPDPVDGRIEHDGEGEPGGTLREQAMELVSRHVPPPTDDEMLDGLRRGLAMARGFGITSLLEANADPRALAAYETLERRGELTARVVVAQAVDPHAGPGQLEALVANRERLQGERLRATAVKVFVDGVIEARTAALLRPYVGTEARGEPSVTRAELEELAVAADRAGLDLHLHAIGDRAIRMSLDAIELAIHDNPPRVRRHAIAHVQLVDPADIPRFAALGVFADFQPLWAYPDPYITELTEPVLGPERSRWLYPIASVFAAGATVVAGSDWSVSSMDPLRGIEVAVTRREIGSGPGLAWIPEEVVDLPMILAAYTRAGAQLLGHERLTGTITPGKRADLVVLDRNLFASDPSPPSEARVRLTIFDGEIIYRAD